MGGEENKVGDRGVKGFFFSRLNWLPRDLSGDGAWSN